MISKNNLKVANNLAAEHSFKVREIWAQTPLGILTGQRE